MSRDTAHLEDTVHQSRGDTSQLSLPASVKKEGLLFFSNYYTGIIIKAVSTSWGNQCASGETNVPAVLVLTVYYCNILYTSLWLLKYLCGSLSLGNINSHNSITLSIIIQSKSVL